MLAVLHSLFILLETLEDLRGVRLPIQTIHHTVILRECTSIRLGPIVLHCQSNSFQLTQYRYRTFFFVA